MLNKFFSLLYQSITFLKNKFISFLLFQLFITLFLWPILLCWGLPLSIASPIGNLIFSPFLFIFLLLSTLIFFFQILSIPNQFFIDLLEYITLTWYKIIILSKNTWLLSCIKPNLIFLISLPIIAILIFHNKKIQSNLGKVFILCLILTITFIYLRYIKIIHQQTEQIKCIKKNLYLLNVNNKITILDIDSLSQLGTSSWIQYNFIPMLIKNGINKIHYLIILKPSVNSFKSLKKLLDNFVIENLYLIEWKGNLKNNGWQIWQNILNTLKNTNINIQIIENNDLEINFDEKQKIIINKTDKIIKKNNLQYPKVNISITTNDFVSKLSNIS